MDSDGLPLVGPAVDLTKIGSINQKRTIAFLNHFISHTVSFLNRFSCVCEEKLSELSNRIQGVEVTMSILEAKLASIPGLENVTVEADQSAPRATEQPTAVNQPGPSPVEQDQSGQPANDEPMAQVEEEAARPVMTVSKDPRYAKYFQMMKVGVPLVALRPKVLADGLDPDLLETPDAPVPGGGSQVSNDSDDESSTASSFSDDDDDDD